MKKSELLFDTGCLLDLYHGRSRIQPYLDAILNGTLLPYLSVLTEAELWRGLRAGELAYHEALIAQFVVLPLQSDAARLAGSWMQQYHATGLGWLDALIVAIGETNDMLILTRDKRLAFVLSSEATFELYS
jgi:predicted nucleic acid-binding protein